ncbi:MAG: class I SAM-dependent methyltransferase [Nitrososphaerales archaeon]|jgi:SAM-dependent methyltransferase
MFTYIAGYTATTRQDESETRESKKAVWIEAGPDAGLTWGKIISGDAFIQKAQTYGVFHERARILEIGSGYGRLLSSMLSANVPFQRYTGLDISERNIKYLEQKFASEPRANFVNGDAESITLSEKYTAIISSLTLKHFYPTFERGLANTSKFLTDEGILLFDLWYIWWLNQIPPLVQSAVKRPTALWSMARSGGVVDSSGKGSLKSYRRKEVVEILRRIGFKNITFDEVIHEKQKRRLLVVARRGKETKR